jgi:ABC-2 type transport system permease protein
VVGLFVRLKLRLLRASLRRPSRLVVVILGLVLGLCTVGLFGVSLFVFRDEPRTAASLGALIATVLALGWATVPIAAFGVDETLDVGRLALLPIRRERLLTGLLAAAFFGVAPILTVLLVGVAVAAVVYSAAAVPVAVLAFVLVSTMCLLLGRVTTSALSRLLRSRRGRDLAVLVGLLVVLALQLPRLLLRNLDEERLQNIGDVLRWTPPGAAVRSVADASAGHWLPALTGLLYAAGTVAALLAGWYVALGAALTVVDASTERPRTRRRPGLIGLLFQLTGGRPGSRWSDGRLGAVAGKELRYAWRDPRLKFSWLQMMVFGLAVPAFSLLHAGGRFAPLVVGMVSALLVSSLGFNQYGPEGSALWMTIVATATERDARTDLAGRTTATALVVGIWVLLGSSALAVVTGTPSAVALALGAGAAVLGAGLGVGAVLSVLAPYPVPDQAGAAFAGPGAGRGCLAGLFWLLGSAVTVVASAPVWVPALVWGGRPVVVPVVLAGGLALGALLAWVGRRLAARLLVERLPELLVAVTPDRT